MWSKYPEVYDELKLIDDLIKETVGSRNQLLSEIVTELVEAGGKRLRPAFVIISAKFGKYNRKKVLPAAGAFEVLHTATLVHDDVIDQAKLRRGRITVSEKYGVDMAIYTGDFLFTKAVLMLSKSVPADRLELVAKAIKSICEGEVDQYRDRSNISIGPIAYLKRISRKTALLFSTACALGGYAGKCSIGAIRALTKFGFNYGMAFQIRDDLNDFLSDAAQSGKPVGNDIARGIITLPAIHAIRRSEAVLEAVERLVGKKGEASEEEISEITRLVKEYGGIAETKAVLEKYIARGMKALVALPDNYYKKVLTELISNLNI